MAVESTWILRGISIFLGLFIVRKLFSAYITSRKARQLGCKPPVKWPTPTWDVLGIGEVRTAIKMFKEKRFLHYILERSVKLNEMYGREVTTFSIYSLGRTIYITHEPKNIQAVLATQFHDFALGTDRRGNMFPLLGNGIFTEDGKSWEHSRSMLRPSFAKERISNLELEERNNRNLHKALPVGKDGWTDEIDLQPLFFRLTLDSSTEFLFGHSVNSQLHELPEHLRPIESKTYAKSQDEKSFSDAFDDAQNTIAYRFRFGKYYNFYNPKKFQESCKRTHDFVDYYVQLALNKDVGEKELEKGVKEGYVFLDELVQRTRDPIELRSQLLNILLAGRDTTASLLGWLFHYLIRNPEVLAKLRRAVLDDFGTYDNPEEVTFAKLKGCQYLQHSLSEALRLEPVVPSNSRRAVKDTTLPTGGGPDGKSPVFIKKGTNVAYTVYIMHRNPAIWGEDAQEFRPERWVGHKHAFDFLPFNAGPRICIGQQFALTSAGYCAVRLLQRFDRFENLDPVDVVQHMVTLTSRSDRGVKVKLHEASN